MHWSRQSLSYENKLTKRDCDSIELIVIHCTELPDLITARQYGERILYDSGTGNSGHFYIDRDGTTEQWVDLSRIAHHVKDHNHNSIGIELVNNGRYPNWYHSTHQEPTENYPTVQIDALNKLLKQLTQQLPNLKHIVGHSDLDQTKVTAEDNPLVTVVRKMDPGPLFPWQQVMQYTRLINIGSQTKNYERTTTK